MFGRVTLKPRPTTLLGLLVAALLLLLPTRGARRRRRVAVLAVLLVAVFILSSTSFAKCAPAPPDALRFATFNIENYPRSRAQEEGAFDAIRALDAHAVGLQEITDPRGFARAASSRLGGTWRTVFSDHPAQRVGVLYDAAALTLVGSAMHRETEIYDGAKPALEAQLRASDGHVTRMFVVHLKARGDGGAVRRAQLDALAPVIGRARSTGDDVLLVGDFNATGPDDVAVIAAFAARVDLSVATKGVECTSYWSRSDGCLGVALDHVLTSWSADASAEGPCRTEGCAMRASCPVFHREVSDHCPVIVDR